MEERDAAPRRDAGSDSARSQSATEELSFELALERLAGVVDRLEGGDLDLEGALAEFEQGVALSRHCAAQLDAAERRIELLTRDGDGLVARPFEPISAAGGDSDEDEEDFE